MTHRQELDLTHALIENIYLGSFGRVISEKVKLIIALFSLLLGVAPTISIAAVAGHFLTLQDVLKMQRIADTQVDPSGKWLLFRVESSEQKDFSLEDQSNMMGQIHAYDLAHHQIMEPFALIGKDWEGARVVSFSPTGERVAISWLINGDLKLGIYTFETGKLTEILATPAFLQFFPIEQTVAWSSDDDFIYNALPDGERTGAAVYSRRATERTLEAMWEKSWRGENSTATVLASHSNQRDAVPRSGSLMRFNVLTGRSDKLADGIYLGLSLSPNRRLLAAAKQGGLRELDPERSLMNRDIWSDFRSYEPVLLNLSSPGRVVSMLKGSEVMLSRYTWTWSASSNELAFFATDANKVWSAGRLYRYSMSAGAASEIRDDGLELSWVRDQRDFRLERMAFLGDELSVPAKPESLDKSRGGERLDWYLVSPNRSPSRLTAKLSKVSPILVGSDPRAIYVQSDNNIWRVFKNGASQNISRSLGSKLTQLSSRISVHYAANSRLSDAEALIAPAADYKHLFFITKSGTVLHSMQMPPDLKTGLAVVPRTHSLVLELERQGGSVLCVLDDKGRLDEVWEYNQHLSAVQAPKLITVSYTLPDGTAATSPVLLPATWHPGLRVPLVVDVYPGSGGYQITSDSPQSAKLFSTLGYAVLGPDVPYSTLPKGDNALGHWADMVLPAVDALVEQGYVDSGRMGVIGMSEGGWSAMALISQTSRFKAAIAGHTTGNFVDFYSGWAGVVWARVFPNEIFPGAPGFDVIPDYSISFGGPPWEASSQYIHSSPLFSVKSMRTPLMLINSDFDGLDPAAANQMFAALYRLKRDVELVTYWGEVHGLTSPANLRDYWARTLAWLDKWTDIVRGGNGQVLYTGDHPSSRGAGAAPELQDYLKWRWFFGDVDTGGGAVSSERAVDHETN